MNIEPLLGLYSLILTVIAYYAGKQNQGLYFMLILMMIMLIVFGALTGIGIST